MRKLMFVLFIVLAAGMVFAGGSSDSGEVVLVVGQSTDPVILDGPMYSDTPTHNLNLVLYNRLYDLTPEGVLEPDLAVDMPVIEENGTKYTIKIKQGVKFHNGNPLTIDDVIFSFNRGAFHEKSQMKSIYAMMYNVQKVDEYTMTFRTGKFDSSKAPAGMKDSDLKTFEERGKYYSPASFGSQVNQLSWLGASINDKETMEKAATDGTLQDYGLTWAVGTGSFKFDSWRQGDSVTLVRNPDYFDQSIKSNVDKIIFKTIRDPSALKTAFLNKEVDLIMNVVPLDAREIERQGGKILTTSGYFGYHYLGFNMNSPRVGQVNADGTPDKDGVYDLNAPSAKLREAILYAINPADIVNSPDIMDKRGIVSLQYMETLPFGKITDPRGTRMEQGNNQTGYYNPTRAKQIFDALPASYKQAGSLKCTVLSGSVYEKEALVVKDQVRRALGVDLINIERVALSEVATRRGTADPNTWDLIVNWTQTDDSYYIFVAFDGFNTSLLHDTKYYEAAAQTYIDQGNSLPNGPARNEAYQNAQKIILNALPRVPLVAMQGISASQTNIEGVAISPSGSFRLKNVVKNK
ncbi:ABC transporter substrate-binding protein [Breznakiella homolactica]|uniref:ABC transporter substrate-binding protein n=1 Tax=Breznakiella homolactica TaxID=2798577 RepID=A0A7T8B9V7_9SPIR|nr:ABC transporter substrate-binding protein [Breznakiella homolactica]QQO08897.1 ABC transporter substrate-binding protein [Breznakiella homolactica]